MHLRQLSVLNFKNYEEAELSFSEGINCFVGDNGEGKTNLLDAIHYLSFCKSFFNPIDSQNIRFEQAFFMVQGIFGNGDKQDTIYCGIKKGQKKQVKRNKKEYERLADHIGRYPVVMVSPSDISLVSEGSEIRRKFMDSIISQYDSVYLDTLIRYNKVLSQRNALLKHFWAERTFDPISLEVYDEKMVQLGQAIYDRRKEFLEEFIPIFQDYFTDISGGKEIVTLEHRSHLKDADFKTQLELHLAKDRAMHYSTVGIHKDDLLFKISGMPLKKFGSQGQQKSYLLALKLAQFECIRKIKGVMPILLLDDIFDKLDDNRVKQLLLLVSNHSLWSDFRY